MSTRLPGPRRWIAAAATAALLAGCSVFGSEEEAPAAADAHGAAAEARAAEPVEAVRSVEIGRTRDGLVITAVGTAPGLGYARPRLEPRRDGRPGVDGLLDYDFTAVPPDPGLEMPRGPARAREVRADRFVELPDLQGARGIRVHGARRGVRLMF